MPYRSPVSEFQFLLQNVVGFSQVTQTERFGEATNETVEAILTEAARMCDDIIAPLQRVGDLEPAHLENGVVRTPTGFGAGFKAVADGGWIGISALEESGGMGLPVTVSTVVNEMMAGACLSLALNPLMSQGQIEALEHHGSDALREMVIPKLLSGEWCGTMNLTEAQAGSDVGALASKAERLGDDLYAISGQKIFITWCDNDFSDNMVHLVLARLPDGVAGTKGISLFLIPKYFPDASGEFTMPNGVDVVSLEHKLGLHGSPTAVMQYAGAKGWLVGEEHGGMAAMFTMMNNARLGVATQGTAISEAATQAALTYASERKQGRAGGTGTIIEHADVRRMLAHMKADTLAARSICLSLAVALDMTTATRDPAWKARAAFLTPIAKAFATDTGIAVAETGVQVHGGMGYIEETGAAQYARDVRVTAIYEGTNGIQAMDLVGRKLMDGGEAAFALLEEVEAGAEAARDALPELAELVWSAAETLREASEKLLLVEARERFAGSVPYLRAFARVLGAHYHLVAALKGDASRQRLADFYITRLLPEAASLLVHATAGSDGLMAITPQDLTA